LFFYILADHAGQDLVPASTVLLMAEHAVGRLEASPADAAAIAVLMNTLVLLSYGGILQQLDPERAISLTVRGLECSGAALK
jgi:hypothetical protein